MQAGHSFASWHRGQSISNGALLPHAMHTSTWISVFTEMCETAGLLAATCPISSKNVGDHCPEHEPGEGSPAYAHRTSYVVWCALGPHRCHRWCRIDELSQLCSQGGPLLIGLRYLQQFFQLRPPVPS